VLWLWLWLLLPIGPSVAVPLQSDDIASDEDIYIFPTYGKVHRSGWRLPIHSWVFEFEADSLLRAPIRAAIRTALGSEINQQTDAIFEERITWALVDNERGKRIRFQAPLRLLTERSAPNGQSVTWVNVPMSSPQGIHPKWVRLTTAPTPDGRIFSGSAILIPPQGISIISDIDDTIKHSNVLDKSELLRNSLARPFRAIDKLRELYAMLQAERVAFHYVSSSPRFLCPVLVKFFKKARIPMGSMHLKQIRFTDSSMYSLFKSSATTKPPIIAHILEDFPGRRFILVGDAGESDPEIYGRFAESHGDQVAFILIRRVRRTKAEDSRIRHVFKNWPRERWALFDEDKTGLDALYGQIKRAVETPRISPRP
jgi:hypothetical protein